MAEKVYTPEVITDQPFPMDDSTVPATVTQSSSGGVSTPATIQNKPFKQRLIAQETIASSFNTLTKKILGVFEFIQQGAIQIGKYINGESGDIRISPDGIVARNKAGLETFALDGDTGDATFRGTVTAGDVQVIDDEGLVSLASFHSGSFYQETSEETTSNVLADIDGSTLTFTLIRPTHVIISIGATIGFGQQDAFSWGGSMFLVMNDVVTNQVVINEFQCTMAGHVATMGGSFASSRIWLLNPGTYTLKLQIKSTTNTKDTIFTRINLDYLILGS